MEESIADVSAIMHVLNADHSHKSTLGPTLTVQVSFEGIPVKALDFLLHTPAKKRSKGQTPAEWEKEVKT